MTGSQVFGGFADEYERHRPDYPMELWDTLLTRGDFHAVADLGSGTGRAGLEMARRGLEVIAVEPEAGMRAEAERVARAAGLSIQLQAGSAEHTGLPVASVDLVTAAQAFHWFDAPAALAECRRVLCPDGILAVWWNDRRVDGVPFMEEYEALIERSNPGYRRGYRQRDWGRALVTGGHFGAVRRDTFAHTTRSDVEGFVALSLTASYVHNALTEEQRARFADALRDLLRSHHGDDPFDVPYQTRLYRAARIS